MVTTENTTLRDLSCRWKHWFPGPWQACLLAVGLSHCGTEAGNPKKPGDTGTPPPSAYANDSQAATALISMQVGEASNAMAEESDSAAAAALRLAGNGEFTRHCVEASDGSTTVTRTANGDFETLRQRGRLRVKRQGKDQSSLLWQKPGKSLHCNQAGTNVVLPWQDGDEVSLHATIDRSRQKSLERVLDGKVLASSLVTVTGQRTIRWQSATAQASGEVVREKSYQHDMQHSFDLQGKDGATHTVSTQSQIPADNPIVVSATYNAATNQWTQQVIKSGQINGVLKDDSRFELRYSNVTYQAASGCRPISGTITGATYALEAKDPSLSFTIDFAQGLNETDSPVYLVFSNGEKKSYYPESCLLDPDT